MIEGEKLIPINIEEQMKSAYIDYSMSVIVSRALPDVRDGLKPVHRRVLYGMHELGIRASGAHKKSARIVGEVLGKYHPHGDTSVYDAMVRMAQPWSLRYMLVDGQGNFGSIDGDNPAAMRYTEARMRKTAEDMLLDIDKETIDWNLNFDDTLKEPSVLPARLPALLLNGNNSPHTYSLRPSAAVKLQNADLVFWGGECGILFGLKLPFFGLFNSSGINTFPFCYAFINSSAFFSDSLNLLYLYYGSLLFKDEL